MTDAVELPDELFNALARGNLVVFVGAGASFDEPSGLLTFVPLAERIAAESLEPFTEIDQRDPSDFLGRLENQGVDVRASVHRLLSKPTSKPNELHRALAALFRNCPPVRVVTTNYDLHVSTAVTDRGWSVPRYDGPALPMGSDFTGVVHIHGSLAQESRHLVVTDRDFSRAYLNQAWATRFLNELFREFVVVFVGYSHNDTIMNILARGLPHNSVRYALVPDGQSETDWHSLNIGVVRYPVRDGNDHTALIAAVTAWGDLARMSPTEHVETLRTILSSGPPDDPRVASYLRMVIADPNAVGIFARIARDPAWLTFASHTETFRSLFGDGATTPQGQVLAYWFAQEFLDQHGDLAISIIRQAEKPVGPTLWQAIALTLQRPNRPTGANFARWVALLLEHPTHPSRGDELDVILSRCRWPDDQDIALVLFRTRVEPDIGYRSGLVSRVGIVGHEYWLRHSWTHQLLPHLNDCAGPICAMTLEHLESAHRFHRAIRGHGTWDPLSASRFAVEPHELDDPNDDTRTLIDAARDSLLALITCDPPVAAGHLARATRSEAPLLRRLAIHVWTEREDLDHDAKVRWLIDADLIHDVATRHESFRLLGQCVSSLSEDIRSLLLSAVLDGPKGEEASVRAQDLLSALAWLAEHDASSGPGSDRWLLEAESVRAAHPDLDTSAHPDFPIWHGELEYLEPSEVVDLAATNPTTALSILHESLAGDGSSYGLRHARYDVGSELARVVANSTAWGMALANELAGSASWTDPVWAGLFRGFADGDLSDDAWSDIAALILRHDAWIGPEREIAQLLTRAGRPLPDGAPLTVVTQLFDAALQLVEQPTRWTEEIEQDSDGWLSKSVNHWAGDLAEFAIRSISRLREDDGQNGDHSYDGPIRLLSALALDTGIVGARARPVLGGNAQFLLATLEDWASETLRPLFDWERDAKAAGQMWDGFLSWGRWTAKVAELLLPLLGAGVLRLESHLRHRADRFCEHVASLMTRTPTPPLASTWIDGFIVLTTDERRTSWARFMAHDLQGASGEDADSAWDSWVGDYWSRRVLGVPRQLASAEAREMLGWTLAFDGRFADAVGLMLQTEFQEVRHYGWFSDERVRVRARSHPAETARLVRHALAHTVGVLFDRDELRAIWLVLAESLPADAPDLRAIRDEAMRLGCLEAADWPEDYQAQGDDPAGS